MKHFVRRSTYIKGFFGLKNLAETKVTAMQSDYCNIKCEQERSVVFAQSKINRVLNGIIWSPKVLPTQCVLQLQIYLAS